jgi:hypothetical protein
MMILITIAAVATFIVALIAQMIIGVKVLKFIFEKPALMIGAFCVMIACSGIFAGLIFGWGYHAQKEHNEEKAKMMADYKDRMEQQKSWMNNNILHENILYENIETENTEFESMINETIDSWDSEFNAKCNDLFGKGSK